MAKCRNCGFLGLVDKESRETRPADDIYRKTGSFESERVSQRFLPVPVCSERQRDFARDIPDDWESVEEIKATRLTALFKDFPCDKFHEWNPGLTIKDHKEMVWHETILRLQKEVTALQKRMHRQVVYTTILATVLAAVINALGSVAWQCLR